jgi:hypothetical protein
MTRTMLMSSALVLAIGALGACIVETRDPEPVPYSAPNRSITCGHFASFQQGCTSGCSSTWDCEASYDSLDVSTQISLDDCSDCLAANMAGGSCSDCSDYFEGSCRQFMEDLLGVSCW